MEINKIPESLKNIDNWVFCDNNKIPKQHKKNGSGIYMNALLDKPETWTDFANSAPLTPLTPLCFFSKTKLYIFFSIYIIVKVLYLLTL